MLPLWGAILVNMVLANKEVAPPLSILHQEARNATFKQVACGRQEICKHRQSQFISPKNLNLSSFLSYPCFCDLPACLEFRDCCVGIMEDKWAEPRPQKIRDLPVSEWTCERLADLQHNAKQREHAWMVSSCVSEDLNLLRHCKARPDELQNEYTYVHDVPVLVNTTLYKNMYCAACHGHPPELFIPLTIQVHCDQENITEEQISRGQYKAGEGVWQIDNGTTHCNLEVKEYLDIAALNSRLAPGDDDPAPIRRCREGVHLCPDDWEDQEVADKCQAYALYVRKYPARNVTYKNPHCAMCNNENLTQCAVGFQQRWNPPSSFSLIFHFSLGGKIVGQQECSSGFVWDALFRTCRRVFSCEAGTRFLAGTCQNTCDLLVLSPQQFTLLENGSIYIERSREVIEPSKFNFKEDGDVEVCAIDVSLELSSIESSSEFSELQGQLTLICTCVSLVGLALHMCVLVALPRLRNLPGLISFATSKSLFLAQILFLWSTSHIRPGHFKSCVALAAVLHFFFLKVFAWTSVMSYDIWRTFSHPTGHMPGRRSNSIRMQFAKYLVVVNIIPLCIVGLSLGLDLLEPDLVISPGYARSSLCWFGNRVGLALFFAAPVCIMLLCNVIMYGIVVLHIREQRRASRYLVELGRRGETTPTTPKYTENDCKLHFSIFNVMGGTWILGLLAGLINHPILWYLFIILNGSQGALIFILQIMKPRVWQMIRNKMAGREDSRTPSTLLTRSAS